MLFNLLRDAEARTLHKIQDDMESFVNVVLYHGLRYLDHTNKPRVQWLLSKVFEEYQVDEFDGTITGGYSKAVIFRAPDFFFRPKLHFTNNRPLTIWLKSALPAIGQWHEYKNKIAVKGTCWESPKRLGRPVREMNESSMVLRDHDYLCEVWEAALDNPNWPENDEANDNLHPPSTVISNVASSQTALTTKPQVAVTTSHQPAKRSRGEVSEEGGETKKQKVEQVQPSL